MKQVAITGITASLVSMLCFLGLQLCEETPRNYSSTIKPQALALALNKSEESIAFLKSKIAAMELQLIQNGNRIKTNIGADRDTGYEDLLDRMDEMERSVSQLALSGDEQARKDSSLIEKRLSERMRRSSEISQSGQSQNLMAESDFETDSGNPLGDFSNSIGEALHSVEGVEVNGMDCRDTICKVSYSEKELFDPQEEVDTRSDIVDKLSQAAIGRTVEVSYASDTSGNTVMYIQLR